MEIEFRAGREEALWSNGSIRVYTLYGEEDRLKADAEKYLVNRLINSDYADFDLEVMNADAVSADAIVSSACQVPFGSERRVVVVKGMEQWRDRPKQSEADRLAAGILNLSRHSCLILIVGAEEDEARRKSAITARLDASVKQVGMLVSCRELKAEALSEWIQYQFELVNKRISQDGMDLLTSSVGAEMRLLDQEIYKLVNYVGDRRQVSVQDVATVVSTHAEDVMFKCVDAIGRRDSDRALLLLNELHRHDTKPQAVAGRLLSLLTRHYRLLWQAKYLASQGVAARDLRSLPERIAAELPQDPSIVQMSFRAGEYMSASEKYTYADIQWVFDRLVLCDLANKGGVTEEDVLFSTDPVSNLQLLVIQLTAR